MSAPLLQATGLGCVLGQRRLFTGIDFSLSSGQWLMLTGANGSGKSTLLRVLAGLVDAASGTVRWRGEPRRAGDPAWNAEFAYQGHANGWKDVLSARENLAMQATLDRRPAPGDDAIAAVLERVGLARQRRLAFARLSAGQRRRLGLARLLLAPRPLWLLDEPTTALDAGGQALFAALLDGHLAAGGCAVVATHVAFATASAPIGLRLGQAVAA